MIDIRFYNESAWPDGAPSPDTLRAPARALALGLIELGQTDGDLRVVVNANRRVGIKLRRRGSTTEVRIHWALVGDPDRCAGAVSHALRTGRFPDSFTTYVRGVASETPPPAPKPIDAVGSTVDLREILREVRRHLPNPEAALGVGIRWGMHSSRRKRQRIRLGSLDPSGTIITVHPALDEEDVPRYVLHHVVYHELCHAVAPPLTRDEARRRGERRIHHRTFRALERRLPDHGRAAEWISRNLDSLLTR